MASPRRPFALLKKKLRRSADRTLIEGLEKRVLLSGTTLAYGGTPQAVPGTVLFSNYDTGGEGVSYHDLSPGNAGGVYRNDGVDLAYTADSGGKYFIGWVGPGEWTNYTVNVAQSGTYAVSVRVATASQGGTFHLSIDGISAGEMSVGYTGGWQKWINVAGPSVSLTAGQHVVRLTTDSGVQPGWGVADYESMTFSLQSSPPPPMQSTPFNGTPQAVPGTIKLSNYDNGGEGVAYHDLSPGNAGGVYRNDGVDLAYTADGGGMYFVGWVGPGEWIKYTVNVAQAGTYTPVVRAATASPGGTFHINLDGVNATGPLTVSNTGGWQNWVNLTGPAISLSAGTHVLTLAFDSPAQAGWGIGDFETLTLAPKSSNPPPPPPPPPTSAPFGGSPQGVPGTIEFENYDTGGEGVAYHDPQPNSSGGSYRSDTIGIAPSLDAENGQALGWINPGEWLNYTVNVAASTTYTVTFRVASGGPGGTFHLNVDGVNASGPVHLGYTGGWWTYTNITVPNVSIPAGKHVLTLVIDSSNAPGWQLGDFNWMQISDNPATSPRTQWWRDAKFGMFIHWGLYSQLAGHWNGQTTSGTGEWIMNALNISLSQYAQVANQFDPTLFNAQQWVQTAKDAGMNYIVMTAKHHDGFSMFNTSVNTYNVVDATPWHQDPIALMSQAAHAAGLHFGVYYSILNWADPNASAAGIDKYMVTMKTQLKELITNDHPDILWFDGDWPTWWNYERGRELTEFIRNLDPSIMINDRLEQRAPLAEDFATPEQMIPTNEPAGRLWETCMTLNDTWGYKDTDNNWKSASTIEQDLSQIVHAGGNYLLNVGPTGQGVIPDPAVQVLDQVGSWIRSRGGIGAV